MPAHSPALRPRRAPAHAAARVALGALLAAAAVPAALHAQAADGAATPTARRPLAPADPARLLRDGAVRRALDALKATNAATLDEQVAICEIPAPPFKEQARGRALADRFRALGLANVRIDAEGNVLGERPGAAPDGPLVVLSGHLDTVFPEGTDVRVRRDTIPLTEDRGGVRLTAPGIGDDCRGLATLLVVARAMRDANVRTAGTLVFVGTVGEEGPGNLRGVRRLFDETLKDRIDAFVSVDGTGLDVVTGAVGSVRLAVSYVGPGGHSYGAFGMPNPAHAAGRAVARLADLQVPNIPKTTFNVGVIQGGQTVNSIPSRVTFELDMRSEHAESLADLERRARAALDTALAAERARWPRSTVPLELEIKDIGRRPAAQQRDDSPAARTALAAAKALGFVSVTGANSTDANVPLALGIPAITMDGGGHGTGAHSPAERYEDGPRGWLGPQWVLLVGTALAGTPGGK